MGNFSRNTFDPLKRYTAVRLQQGVPLVDADWNELQDVTRSELYDAMLVALPNSMSPSMLLTPIGNNDLQLNTGIALVQGRPAALNNPMRYSTQRYANPATAAADGVPVTPPLTTPTQPRTDLVFIDVFEREVGSAEDPSIVNPAIGVETAVRLRRELVLRVAEGGLGTGIPVGHMGFMIATINRPAGVAAITQDMIDDLGPRNPVATFEDIAVPPLLMPSGNPTTGSLFTPWVTGAVGFNFVAVKPANASAFGLAPVFFPTRARIRTMRVRGQNNGAGTMSFSLTRVRLDTGASSTVVADSVGTGAFDRLLAVNQSTGVGVVNNQQFSYFVHASAGTSAGDAEIRGFAFRYNVG
jgi:hypothetical protein